VLIARTPGAGLPHDRRTVDSIDGGLGGQLPANAIERCTPAEPTVDCMKLQLQSWKADERF